MEVINENSALLTNYEVFSLLTDIQNGRGQKKPNKHQQNLATITYETVKYLESTPCRKQDPDVLKIFSEKAALYKLTKAEQLQLLNLRPSTAVEIQLIVEESEERLTEEQIYELLDVISGYVPCLEEAAEVQDTSEMTENIGKLENQEVVNEDVEMEGDDDDEDEDVDVDASDELIAEDKNDIQVGVEDNDDND